MHAAEFGDRMDGSPSSFGRWIVPALILSILLHVLFWYWARNVSFNNFSQQYYEREVPRTFHIDRVEIDASLLAPEPDSAQRAASAPEAIKLPDEAPAFGRLMADVKGPAAAPTLETPLLDEKPRLASTTLEETLEDARRNGAESALKDSRSLSEAIFAEKPETGGKPLSDLLSTENSSGKTQAAKGALAGGDVPGFSNLDDLLAQTGPLSPETAPILMPTDLLFGFDNSGLQPEALASLEKLGKLIQRNPQATFVIEGHTDSIGSDEYNLELSQRRADSVKAWLVQAMHIAPARIQTRGFGKSRLIAPPSPSVEDAIAKEQINRRVEIVIH